MPNFLQSGSNIVFDGRHATISSKASNGFSFRFTDGRTEIISEYAVQHAVNEGRLVADLNPPGGESGGLPFLREGQILEIERKFAYIKPLLDAEFPDSEVTRQRVIREVAKRLGEPLTEKSLCDSSREKAPSISQIRRWRICFEESGRNPLSLLRKEEHKKRRSKVAEIYLEVMDDVIDQHYLCERPKSISGTYQVFNDICTSRQYDQCTIPTYETFRKRVNGIHPIEVLQAQQGAAAVRLADQQIQGMYMPRKPLERVEVDAVHLNLGLVDEQGTYIGKIVLFVAIDVYSRAVLGFSYKVAKRPSEDGETAIECLKMAMSFKPKTMFSCALENDWEMTGKIGAVVVDPGTALIAKSMTMFLGGLNVSRHVTESRSPWRKPFIERFFRTLRGELMSQLPGYAPKETEQYLITHNLPKEACMTRQQFESCLVRWIVDGYHQSQHKGLGAQTPQEAWRRGLRENGDPELVHDMKFLRNFAAHQKRYTATVKSGIKIKDARYNSRELGHFIPQISKSKCKTKCRVDVLWCSHDISKIQVYDPLKKHYFTVPCKNQEIQEGTRVEEYKASQQKTGRPNRVNPITNQDPEIVSARKFQKQNLSRSKNRSHPTPTEMEPLSKEELENQLNNGNQDLNPRAAELREFEPADTVPDQSDETLQKTRKPGKKQWKTRRVS